MPTLSESIVGLGENERVTCRCIDGRKVTGTTTEIERDQAGVRIEVAQNNEETPAFRIRLNRSPTDWFTPYVERREETGWEQYGQLVNLE